VIAADSITVPTSVVSVCSSGTPPETSIVVEVCPMVSATSIFAV
jgi:hypothetical protein